MILKQTTRTYTTPFGISGTKEVIELHNGTSQLYCTSKELLQICEMLRNPKKKSKKYIITFLDGGCLIQKVYKGNCICWVSDLDINDIETLKTITTPADIKRLVKAYIAANKSPVGCTPETEIKVYEGVFDWDNLAKTTTGPLKFVKPYVEETSDTSKLASLNAFLDKEGTHPQGIKLALSRAIKNPNIDVSDVDVTLKDGSTWRVKQINNLRTGHFLRLSFKEFNLLCDMIRKDIYHNDTFSIEQSSSNSPLYNIKKGKYFLNGLTKEELQSIVLC